MQPASQKPRDSQGTDRPIRIGRTVLRAQRHICAFFNSHDDHFVTHVKWALEDRPGVGGLLKYEASANLAPFENAVICAYDLPKFGGEVVVDIMRTHPLIIIGGILQQNPFFVPPEEFLREPHERRGRGQGASSAWAR